MNKPISRLAASLGLAFILAPHPLLAEESATPVLEIPALSSLGSEWRPENPYRGDARAAAAGKSIFAQACQRCHGVEAGGRGPAPDLRLLGKYCRRVADQELRSTCLRDADDYFRRSVLFGKVRLGIVHMPAWKDVLSQEMVWAVRSYIESRDTR